MKIYASKKKLIFWENLGFWHTPQWMVFTLIFGLTFIDYIRNFLWFFQHSRWLSIFNYQNFFWFFSIWYVKCLCDMFLQQWKCFFLPSQFLPLFLFCCVNLQRWNNLYLFSSTTDVFCIFNRCIFFRRHNLLCEWLLEFWPQFAAKSFFYSRSPLSGVLYKYGPIVLAVL